MKKTIAFAMMLVFFCGQVSAQWVVTDPTLTATVNSQTAKQAADSIKQLTEMIKTVQLLQSQVADTQNLLKLAQKASEGLEGVGFVTDFRNVVLNTNELIREVQEVIDTGEDMSENWRDIFGTMDDWIKNSEEIFEGIGISDKVNSSGYLIADSYQNLYEQNSQYAQELAENSKDVNEKGALKQIAQELAVLIQMENHTMYLLSEMLKVQSVENANTNLVRKEDAVKFEQENTGVRRFMGIVDSGTLGMD